MEIKPSVNPTPGAARCDNPAHTFAVSDDEPEGELPIRYLLQAIPLTGLHPALEIANPVVTGRLLVSMA